jgi:hypothetical protein
MFEQILTIEVSANSVAWYGAIVATFGFIMSTYSILRDRAKVKIKYEPNMYICGGQELNYPEKIKHLSISVINRGRRPIRIESAYLKSFGEKKILLLADSFADHRPKIITEEKPMTTFLIKQDSIDIKKVYCVIVIDGASRSYKKYVKPFPFLLQFYYWLKNSAMNK